jgi:hypothetical protein
MENSFFDKSIADCSSQENPRLYGKGMFIKVITRGRYGDYPSQINPNHTLPKFFFVRSVSIFFSHLSRALPISFFHLGFPTKTSYELHISPMARYMPFPSSFNILLYHLILILHPIEIFTDKLINLLHVSSKNSNKLEFSSAYRSPQQACFE